MSELSVSFFTNSLLNSKRVRTLILSIDTAIKFRMLKAKYKYASVTLDFLKNGNKIVAIIIDVIPLKLNNKVEIMIPLEFADEDEGTGAKILRRALEEPLRRIATNAGQDGSVIVQRVLALNEGEGYDAAGDTYGNMIELGIIDPAKVTKAALENAVSIAGMVLTTNVLVTDEPENAAPAMPGGEMY